MEPLTSVNDARRRFLKGSACIGAAILAAAAVAAATGLVQSGLFEGQSQQFFDAVTALAVAADAAERG